MVFANFTLFSLKELTEMMKTEEANGILLFSKCKEWSEQRMIYNSKALLVNCFSSCPDSFICPFFSCYDVVDGSARYKGWLAGYQVALDTAKTAKTLFSQSNFAIGYTKDDLTLHTAV